MPEHWRTVPGGDPAFFLRLEEPDGWYEATVDRSGGVDLTRYFNEPYGGGDPEERVENTDSVHIYDVDDFVARLRSLQAVAREHFGPDWPR